MQSILWTIGWAITILASIITFENIIKDLSMNDLDIVALFTTAIGWAIIIVFWFN